MSCLISRGVGQLLAIGALPDAFEYFGGRVYADVGGDERVLQLVKQICVDLLTARDGVFQAIHQARASLLDPGFQALEQVRFLFCSAK